MTNAGPCAGFTSSAVGGMALDEAVVRALGDRAAGLEARGSARERPGWTRSMWEFMRLVCA